MSTESHRPFAAVPSANESVNCFARAIASLPPIFMHLALLVAMSGLLHAERILFLDPLPRDTAKDSVCAQEKVQQDFLAASTIISVIDFDDLPCSSSGVTVDELTDQGVVFSHPGDMGLALYSTNGLYVPYTRPCSLHHRGYRVDERILVNLVVPHTAVGFWLIDSELFGGDDYIDFYSGPDGTGDLLSHVKTPITGFGTGDARGNFFVGLVSPETAIGSVIITDSIRENEGIGIDHVIVAEAGGAAPLFKRGDANNDGSVNIADPIFVLNHLFGAESNRNPRCPDAADSNDDGVLDIADPIYLLNFLFGAGQPGPAPPSPYPNCGVDATEDCLSCSDPMCE